MPRFFIRANQIEDGIVTLLGDDAHHISRSLRMAAGECITVCDMQKNEYECELTDFLSDRVLAKILTSRASDTEPPYYAHLYQALPKGDKLDSVIQKAVECGASEITTFESERCIVRAKGENESKKVERRQRIALEAAKQSGRGIVPTVNPTISFSEMCRRASDADIALFCYEGDGTESLSTVLQTSIDKLTKPNPTVAIIIGSEGGFSLAEAEKICSMGILPVGLGKRILRTETASGFALACLVYALEMKK